MQWRGSRPNLLMVLLGVLVLLCLQFSVRAAREGSTAMSTGLFPAAPNTPAEDSSTAGSQLRGQSSAPSSALAASSRDPSPAASEAAAAAASMQEDYEREDQRLRMMQRALGKVPPTELTRLVDELEESQIQIQIQIQAQAQAQPTPGAAVANGAETGSAECTSFATMRTVVQKIAALHDINTKREEGRAAAAGGAEEPSSVAISAAEAAILPATHEAACMHHMWELRQAELKKYTEGGGGGASGAVNGSDSGDRSSSSSRGGPVHEMKRLAAVLEEHFEAYTWAIGGVSAGTSSLSAPEAATLTQHLPMALIDLESYLEDIDNARDFHTIGGWSVLLRYLDAGARLDAGGNESAPLLHRSRISSLAAWCMGTAVKNNAQYQAWMLEGPGGTGAGAGAGAGDSVVHSLIRLLQIPLPAGAGEGACGAAAGSAAPSPPGTVGVAESVAELHRKALYALSAVSGNNIALKDHMAEAAADVKQAKGGAFAAVVMELLHGADGDNERSRGSTTLTAHAPLLLERSRKVWNLLADLVDEWEHEIEDTEAAYAANAAAAAVTAAGGNDMPVDAAAKSVAAARAGAGGSEGVVAAHNALTTEFCSPQWRALLHRTAAELVNAASSGSGASALAADANEIDLASLDLDGDDDEEGEEEEGREAAAAAAAASRARASSLRGVERAVRRVEEKLPSICAW